MNYLELCQQVNLYTGFQGTISSVDTSGYQALLVDAVKKSWIDIQNEREDWDFMYTSVSFSTVQGTSEYTTDTIFGTSTEMLGKWDKLRIVYDYKPLRYINYKNFVLIEDTTQEEPSYFTIRPSDRAILINTPDDAYTITAYYTKTPQELENNADIPAMPKKHHNVIVYAAVIELAAFVSSAEIYQKNITNYSKSMGQLMRDHVPAREIRKRPIA